MPLLLLLLLFKGGVITVPAFFDLGSPSMFFSRCCCCHLFRKISLLVTTCDETLLEKRGLLHLLLIEAILLISLIAFVDWISLTRSLMPV